jgi:hypothetical protein
LVAVETADYARNGHAQHELRLDRSKHHHFYKFTACGTSNTGTFNDSLRRSKSRLEYKTIQLPEYSTFYQIPTAFQVTVIDKWGIPRITTGSTNSNDIHTYAVKCSSFYSIELCNNGSENGSELDSDRFSGNSSR